MAPSLYDSRLSLRGKKRRRNVRFSGRLVSRSGEFIAGAPITLKLGRKRASIATNALGRFSYVTSTRALRRASVVFASTAGGEAVSKSLKVSKFS
jgi:hypothetical protein